MKESENLREEALLEANDKRVAKYARKDSNPWGDEKGKKANFFRNCYGLMLITMMFLFLMAVGITVVVWLNYFYIIRSKRTSLVEGLLSILFCEINAIAWLLLLYCYRLESHTHRTYRHAATMIFKRKILDKNRYIKTIFSEIQNEKALGMFYFDERLPEPYAKKFEGAWNTVLIFVFRLIWFGCASSVIVYHALTGRIKLYYISQQSNWLAAIMTFLGLIHVFVKDKRKNLLTKIYGPFYLICIGNIFLVGLIVIPDNLITLATGGTINDFGWDDIVEHYLNPVFIFLPFIWEYIDFKILWTPWPMVYGIFYIICNFIYVMKYDETVYGDLKFDNLFTVAISIVVAVVFWIPT